MAQTHTPQPSKSEDNGLSLLTHKDLTIYSVGISTGGVAEMRMAEMEPERHIIATTIDEQGKAFADEQIAQKQLNHQIETKLEDVAGRLPYHDDYFDYVYARLVLHYLPKDSLKRALAELHRALKPGGKIFIVVRSDQCEHAHMPDSVYDPATELTEYTETDPFKGVTRLKRHFFSEPELRAYVERAGFDVNHVASYDEHLFKDFMRTIRDTRVDQVVELVASKPRP